MSNKRKSPHLPVLLWQADCPIQLPKPISPDAFKHAFSTGVHPFTGELVGFGAVGEIEGFSIGLPVGSVGRAVG